MSIPDDAMKAAREQADAIVDRMALTYRHDYGLLTGKEREGARLTFEQIAYHDVAPAIARAIMAERERDRWQPIETAPKDGTRVFVLTKTAIHSAVYDRVDSCWRVLPRKTTTIVPVPGVPTHWQPLPAMPASIRGGEL